MRNRLVTYSPAATFHALADPTRLAVFELLRDAPQSAGQIAAAFPISRPAISKHLRQLHKARLVVPTRRGRHRFFQVNVEPLRAVDQWLDHYRIFWSQNLNSLKLFVEQEQEQEHERERETSALPSSTKTETKSRKKYK